MEKNKKAISYADFMGDSVAEIDNAWVVTPSDWTFEIKAMDPGELLIITGSPLIAALMPDDGTAPKQPDQTTTIKIMSDPSFRSSVVDVVCLSVVSLNFVNKPEAECDTEKEETPIGRLPFNDLMFLYRSIVEHSMGSSGTDFYTFRTQNAGEQGSGNTDTPDGTIIREASVGNTIPQ